MKAALLAVCLAAPSPAAWFHGGSAKLEPARALFDAGRYEQVVAELEGETLERLRANDQRGAYLYLGLAYQKLGKLDRAVGVFQLGARLFPKDLNLLTALGQALHASGLEQEAEPVFQRILKIHPNNAVAHLGLGQIDHALGFLDRSAGHFDKVLETMSENADVWREYSELMLSSRQLPKAEAAARRSLALKDTTAARIDLARVQRASGKLADALTTLGEAVAAAPKEPGPRRVRALWLLEANRYNEALADAESLLYGEPGPIAYWVRARVRLKNDQYRAAVDDLKRVVAAERDAPFCAAAARELLKQLGAS